MDAEKIMDCLQALHFEEKGNAPANAVLLKGIRSVGNAEVYKVTVDDGTPVLVKTYCHNFWPIRKIWGPWNLRNEARALERMAPYVRVPKVYGFIGSATLASEFLDNATELLSEDHYTDESRPPQSFFQELIAAIQLLHDNGICHGDLRRANVMIDDQNHPCIIDVATACFKNSSSGFIKKSVFNAMCASDNFSLAKLVGRYYPELMDERLEGFMMHAPWYLRLGRYFRKNIYRKFRLHHKHKKH